MTPPMVWSLAADSRMAIRWPFRPNATAAANPTRLPPTIRISNTGMVCYLKFIFYIERITEDEICRFIRYILLEFMTINIDDLREDHEILIVKTLTRLIRTVQVLIEIFSARPRYRLH
jgi:hypothetical protein